MKYDIEMARRLTAALIAALFAVVQVHACQDFRQALSLHNQYRSAHGSSALAEDKQALASAKDWASKLAKDECKLRFDDDNSGRSMSLYALYGSADSAQCVKATNNFYSQQKNYNFSIPYSAQRSKFSSFGLFTQLVWKSSTGLGCASAVGKRDDDSPCVVVVCEYAPGGNIVGDAAYAANVFPPKNSSGVTAKASPSPRLSPSPRPADSPRPEHSPKQMKSPRPARSPKLVHSPHPDMHSPKMSPKPSPVMSPKMMASPPIMPSPSPVPVKGNVTKPLYSNIRKALLMDCQFAVLNALASTIGLQSVIGNTSSTETLFAPTNLAFSDLLVSLGYGAQNWDVLLEFAVSNPQAIAKILMYHVVNQPLPASQLTAGRELTTLNGETLTINRKVTGEIFVNAERSLAQIIKADLTTAKGYIHKIDTVLIPQNIDFTPKP